MINGIRTIYTCGLNKGFFSKYRVGSQVYQETTEEGRNIDNSKPNALNNIYYQSSSQILTNSTCYMFSCKYALNV